MSETKRVHLDATSTLRDLLGHPAFDGFAPLILPWDDRAYDEQVPLAASIRSCRTTRASNPTSLSPD